MFTNSDEIIILAIKNSKKKVYKLKLDREAKEEYVNQFNSYVNKLLYDEDNDLKDFHDFETNYSNSEEENFKIDDFFQNNNLISSNKVTIIAETDTAISKKDLRAATRYI